MKDFLRLVALMRPQAPWMAAAVLLSALASLAHMALMATSGWFITAMALAGTAGIAIDVFAPAAYIRGFQGASFGPGSVSTMTKHFPGGGPQELGMDPHYSFGKYQKYSSEAGFAYNMKPFEAAIAAGVSSIMPYYGVPMSGRDSNLKPIPITNALLEATEPKNRADFFRRWKEALRG